MQKQLVTLEIAKLLKELGFSEECAFTLEYSE